MKQSAIDKAIEKLEAKKELQDAAIQLAIDELNAQRPKTRLSKPRIVKAAKGEPA